MYTRPEPTGEDARPQSSHGKDETARHEMGVTVSTDERRYLVVRNHEDQYSIWPAGQDIPDGWAAEGFDGPKNDCLAHIAEVWTDLRPLSLRRAVGDEGDVRVG
ncbi:MbtH family protein [Streptomyces sp. NBC_00872]|uniref:MbtH family protein n=1 Tax=Streptomyces sp. NBC_00872 TaxID=2903686 RepID=UPI00386FE82C